MLLFCRLVWPQILYMAPSEVRVYKRNFWRIYTAPTPTLLLPTHDSVRRISISKKQAHVMRLRMSRGLINHDILLGTRTYVRTLTFDKVCVERAGWLS